VRYIILSVLLLSISGCATAPRVVTKAPALPIPTTTRSVSYQSAKSSVQWNANEKFIWPVNGTVISTFGIQVDKLKNKGIDIKAEDGGRVLASKSGRVVFCDDQLKGFGKTVILDHGGNYQTVYAYNSDILVNVGDFVSQKAVIALTGKTGRAKEPCLHFEIRKDGEPQNPFHYLSH